MSLQLGSHGPVVAAWQRTMRARFASYALAADGGPLKPDTYYGYDDRAVQQEYQRRTGQPETGIVTDQDLHKLLILPTLFTVHGTGQPDPFGIGYPADAARRCLDLFWWQPVGDYPAQAVPMDASADAGERSLAALINDRNRCPGPLAMFDYSQGSICGGRVRDRLRNGDMRDRYSDFLGSASWGNPKRPTGSYAGNVDPGGHGIDPDLEDTADPRCLNLAAKGDLYTTCPDGDIGEMERAIFNAVFRRWTGKDTVPEQLLEMVTNPIREVAAAGKAIWNGGLFVLRGAGPHVRYHLDECPGTGVTYYEHAIAHIRDIGLRYINSVHAA